ncbi:M23 family metallopeptidase [Marinicellulosiphila megalodicopiae]|uniref:M23 family metallopeptidase n=1 Tax=Marinicellulosiphila megalodicopiae TaxID=2724896 RepID=UPI003BB1A4B3
MHLIVVKNRYGDSAILSSRVLVGLGVIISMLLIAIIVFSFNYIQLTNAVLSYQDLEQKNQHLESQLVKQKNENVIQSNAYRQHIDAFGVRLAQLQSEVTRMNALGERLVEVAGISTEEFNFQALPATGGPIAESGVDDVFSCSPETLSDEMYLLNNALVSQADKINVLSRFIEDKDIFAQSYISGRPITDSKGWLSSRFGKRKDPFENKIAMHKGVDYAAAEGTDIISTGAGVITWAGKRYGYGNLVEVNHGNGIVTRYGHAKAILVQTGDIVEKGSPIALVGNTGRSTGPHIHYEVLINGAQVNPEKYLIRDAL